eukprot:gene8094-7493_t
MPATRLPLFYGDWVTPALNDPNIDGVYTDCSSAAAAPQEGTGMTHGVTQAELVGRQAAFDTALALAKSKGKWISWWNGSALSGGPSQAGAACAAAMNSAVALSLLYYHITQNTLAAFLISRGPSAVIVLPPGTNRTNPNADPGVPSSAATKTGADATAYYTRSYTNANVTFDCATLKSTITWK